MLIRFAHHTRTRLAVVTAVGVFAVAASMTAGRQLTAPASQSAVAASATAQHNAAPSGVFGWD